VGTYRKRCYVKGAVINGNAMFDCEASVIFQFSHHIMTNNFEKDFYVMIGVGARDTDTRLGISTACSVHPTAMYEMEGSALDDILLKERLHCLHRTDIYYWKLENPCVTKANGFNQYIVKANIQKLSNCYASFVQSVSCAWLVLGY
jgi:hypothetical protein